MPRDASGNYTLPAGNPVISGTVITPTWANPTMSDLGQEMTDSLSRTGKGGMLVSFTITDGDNLAPGLAFVSEPSTGLYRAFPGDMRTTIEGLDVTRYLSQPYGFEVWSGTEWQQPLFDSGNNTIDGDWTITGNWTFEAATSFEANSTYVNNTGINGRNVAATGVRMIRVNTSDQVEVGSGTLSNLYSSADTHIFQRLGVTVAQMGSNASGSLLAADTGGTLSEVAKLGALQTISAQWTYESFGNYNQNLRVANNIPIQMRTQPSTNNYRNVLMVDATDNVQLGNQDFDKVQIFGNSPVWMQNGVTEQRILTVLDLTGGFDTAADYITSGNWDNSGDWTFTGGFVFPGGSITAGGVATISGAWTFSGNVVIQGVDLVPFIVTNDSGATKRFSVSNSGVVLWGANVDDPAGTLSWDTSLVATIRGNTNLILRGGSGANAIDISASGVEFSTAVTVDGAMTINGTMVWTVAPRLNNNIPLNARNFANTTVNMLRLDTNDIVLVGNTNSGMNLQSSGDLGLNGADLNEALGLVQTNLAGFIPVSLVPFSSLELLGLWDAGPGLNPADGDTSGQYYVISEEGTLFIFVDDSGTAQNQLCEPGDSIVWLEADVATQGWYYIPNSNPTVASQIAVDPSPSNWTSTDLQNLANESGDRSAIKDLNSVITGQWEFNTIQNFNAQIRMGNNQAIQWEVAAGGTFLNACRLSTGDVFIWGTQTANSIVHFADTYTIRQNNADVAQFLPTANGSLLAADTGGTLSEVAKLGATQSITGAWTFNNLLRANLGGQFLSNTTREAILISAGANGTGEGLFINSETRTNADIAVNLLRIRNRAGVDGLTFNVGGDFAFPGASVLADGSGQISGAWRFNGPVDGSAAGGILLRIGQINSVISGSDSAFVGFANTGGFSGALAGDLLLVPRTSILGNVRVYVGTPTPLEVARFTSQANGSLLVSDGAGAFSSVAKTGANEIISGTWSYAANLNLDNTFYIRLKTSGGVENTALGMTSGGTIQVGNGTKPLQVLSLSPMGFVIGATTRVTFSDTANLQFRNLNSWDTAAYFSRSNDDQGVRFYASSTGNFIRGFTSITNGKLLIIDATTDDINTPNTAGSMGISLRHLGIQQALVTDRDSGALQVVDLTGNLRKAGYRNPLATTINADRTCLQSDEGTVMQVNASNVDYTLDQLESFTTFRLLNVNQTASFNILKGTIANMRWLDGSGTLKDTTTGVQVIAGSVVEIYYLNFQVVYLFGNGISEL